MGTLTLPLHLNHPQFVFLRAKFAGGLQLGMFLNDMHDFLDQVSKRVLKKYFPHTQGKQINILVIEGTRQECDRQIPLSAPRSSGLISFAPF